MSCVPFILSPKSHVNSPISRVREGDLIEINSHQQLLQVLVDEHEFNHREPQLPPEKASGSIPYLIPTIEKSGQSRQRRGNHLVVQLRSNNRQLLA